jgi:hypothetical protein
MMRDVGAEREHVLVFRPLTFTISGSRPSSLEKPFSSALKIGASHVMPI